MDQIILNRRRVRVVHVRSDNQKHILGQWTGWYMWKDYVSKEAKETTLLHFVADFIQAKSAGNHWTAQKLLNNIRDAKRLSCSGSSKEDLMLLSCFNRFNQLSDSRRLVSCGLEITD